ncbi:uncharacterized protein METZ01_LOCUS325384, partial [marine metagenome]
MPEPPTVGHWRSTATTPSGDFSKAAGKRCLRHAEATDKPCIPNFQDVAAMNQLDIEPLHDDVGAR